MPLTTEQYTARSGSGAHPDRVAAALSAAYASLASEIAEPKHGVAETRWRLNREVSLTLPIPAHTIANATLNGVPYSDDLTIIGRNTILLDAPVTGTFIASISYDNTDYEWDEAAYELTSWMLAQSGLSQLRADDMSVRVQSCDTFRSIIKRLEQKTFGRRPYYIGPASGGGTPVNPGTGYTATFGETGGAQSTTQFGPPFPARFSVTMPVTTKENSSWYINLPDGISVTNVTQDIFGGVDVTSTWVRNGQQWVDSGLASGVASSFTFTVTQ